MKSAVLAALVPLLFSCTSSLPVRAGVDSEAAVFARLDVPSGVFIAVSEGDAVAWVRDTTSGLTLVSASVDSGHAFLALLRGERMHVTWKVGGPIPPEALPILLEWDAPAELAAVGILPDSP